MTSSTMRSSPFPPLNSNLNPKSTRNLPPLLSSKAMRRHLLELIPHHHGLVEAKGEDGVEAEDVVGGDRIMEAVGGMGL